MSSASGENWKELLSLTISTEASFNSDSNEEALNKHLKYIQILPTPTEGATEIIREGVYY